MFPAAAPPLDDDNLLSDILLCLPPQPSSLPRASAVCKRWPSLVSDRGFIRRFRRRNPPLLCLFRRRAGSIHFESSMEPPNRVPHGRFSSPIDDGDSFWLLGSRHGLVLIFHSSRDQILVWDPVTGDQHRTATPPGFDMQETTTDGTVIRAPGDAHHFQVQVVLVDYKQEQNPGAVVCFYSSETGVWSDLISTPVPGNTIDYPGMPAVLVGDSLYWLLSGNPSVIVKVDLDRQSLAVIQVPADIFAMSQNWDFMVVRAAGGGLGLLSASDYTARLWIRNTNCDGVASWVLGRTIELDKLLPLNSQKEKRWIVMIAYAEENNEAFLWTHNGIFMVQLESLQFNKLFEDIPGIIVYPLESVYAAETSIGGESDGADQDMPV